MQQLTPAYILHRYPYRETSFLLKVFTQDEGLVTLVARNAKRTKSNWYGLLQPFQKLNITYKGKGSVLTLIQAERAGESCFLEQKSLFSGFYLNELLLKFLAPHDIHEALFIAYTKALQAMQLSKEAFEPALREFELSLFEELGLLPDFILDESDEPIELEAWYQLEKHHQPRRILKPNKLMPYHFQGHELLSLRSKHFNTPEQLKTAKRFTRLWLEYYRIGQELNTREIFAAVFQE